jgi:hypothetical protein
MRTRPAVGMYARRMTLEDAINAAVEAALAGRCGTCDNWGWVKARPGDPYCFTEKPCPECVAAGRMHAEVAQ